MKKWIIRIAVAIPILLVLVLAAAALSNLGLPTESHVIERLSEAEKGRLAEAFHLRRALGDRVWPGWDEARIPIIVHNEAYAFLVDYPQGETPPDGWVRVPRDEEQGGTWEPVPGDTFRGETYYRQRLRDAEATPENFTVRVGDHWAATLWTREYARVSFVTGFREELPPFARPIVPYRLLWRLLLGDTETYVGALAHESFHAYQGMEAEQRLYAAEFAVPLEGRYPWDDEAAEAAWQAELDLLHAAVEASSDAEAADLAGQFLARRRERREAHTLSDELIDYERKMEWLEGLAKYAELAIQREAAVAAGYLPVPAIGDDPDFRGYRDREQYWDQQVDEIPRLSGRSGDTRFYQSGFGQAVLLDRLMPGWEDQAWSEGVWLEDLLVEAITVRGARGRHSAGCVPYYERGWAMAALRRLRALPPTVELVRCGIRSAGRTAVGGAMPSTRSAAIGTPSTAGSRRWAAG